MGVLATIFGSGDLIGNIARTIDAVHTSDEEELAARSKAKTDLLNAYAPFKIAQRLLMLLIAVTYVGMFWIVMGITIYTTGADIDAMISVMEQFKIAYIMLMIVGFYFGGGFAEGIVQKVRK